MDRSPLPRSIGWSRCVYRRLLVLLPVSFRQSYAADMVQVFTDICWAAYRRGGALAVFTCWPHMLTDLGMTSIAEWLMSIGGSMFIKRLVDIWLAALMLILTAPLQLILAILIRLDSAGPSLFRQVRIGQRGRPFIMVKFRTMTNDAAHTVTRVGGWLRLSALDELPQLINVLCGDMSLVGPRPPLLQEADLSSATWQQLLTVPPGLTGPGQLLRLTGGTAEHEHSQNLAYTKQHSLIGDLHILGRTLGWMLGRR